MFRYFLVLLTFFSLGQIQAQNLVGNWTLDWTQVMDTLEHTNPLVSDGLLKLETENEYQARWEIRSDSLLLFRKGLDVMRFPLEWINVGECRFTEVYKGKKIAYRLKELDRNRLQMTNDHSKDAIWLKRLP
jgi:hypothetical protein